MRQYRIITKTPGTEEIQLEPGIHGNLYNIPEVRDAVAFVEQNTCVEFIGIRIGARFYGVAVIYADELKPNHFQLKDLENNNA